MSQILTLATESDPPAPLHFDRITVSMARRQKFETCKEIEITCAMKAAGVGAVEATMLDVYLSMGDAEQLVGLP